MARSFSIAYDADDRLERITAIDAAGGHVTEIEYQRRAATTADVVSRTESRPSSTMTGQDA